MSGPGIYTWNEETILAHLRQVAEEQLNMTPQQTAAIDPEAPLVDTLRLDSLAQVVLMTTVEQDFGCTFEPEEWRQLQTVRDLVNLIAGHAGKEPVA